MSPLLLAWSALFALLTTWRAVHHAASHRRGAGSGPAPILTRVGLAAVVLIILTSAALFSKAWPPESAMAEVVVLFESVLPHVYFYLVAISSASLALHPFREPTDRA